MGRVEPANPDVEVIQCVHDALAIKFCARFDNEQAFVDNEFDGTISGTVIVKHVLHGGKVYEAASARDPDMAIDKSGAQVNQDAIRLEYSMRFVEGMNHARMGDSSQDPGEHRPVEGFVGVVDMFGLANPVGDAAGELFGQVPTRGADELRVRVNGMNVSAQAREPQREASITASDFDDALATPVGSTLECS
jgi:hypothetical protein